MLGSRPVKFRIVGEAMRASRFCHSRGGRNFGSFIREPKIN
jgi:hypothetical protein